MERARTDRILHVFEVGPKRAEVRASGDSRRPYTVVYQHNPDGEILRWRFANEVVAIERARGWARITA